nr:class III extradiol ring-cleavage dioxygenase [Haliscomenobacter sp.]
MHETQAIHKNHIRSCRYDDHGIFSKLPGRARRTGCKNATAVPFDHEWGLDHGTWTVIRHMYPEANIPVLQLSIDYYKSPQYHYALIQELAELRKKGVLIVGSGNMVHNLGMVAWDRLKDDSYGFDWTLEMNDLFKKHISEGNHQPLIQYEGLHKSAKLAIPTPDHYYPLLYILGLQDKMIP